MKILAPFIRFGGVSILCLALHNFVLIAADANGIGYGAATVISFSIVVVFGYILHTSYTFATAPTVQGLFRYVAALLVNIPAQWLLLWLLIGKLDLPMVIAAPLSTAVLTLFNFVAGRWALLGANYGREKP